MSSSSIRITVLSPTNSAFSSTDGNASTISPTAQKDWLESQPLRLMRVTDCARSQEFIQQNISDRASTVSTINALIVVGAFISGVQAQMISFSYERNDSRMATITNLFVFTGLTLDVIGTSAGVIHALAVQRYMGNAKRLIAHLDRLVPAQKRVEGLLARADLGLSTVREVVDIFRRHLPVIYELREKHMWFELAVPVSAAVAERRPSSTSSICSSMTSGNTFTEPVPEDPPSPHAQTISFAHHVLHFMHLITRRNDWGVGLTPVVSLAGGILCLWLSIICFAASTQARSVWIVCAVLGTVVSFCVLVPLVLEGVLTAVKWRKNRKTVLLRDTFDAHFRDIEKQL